jgi:hypothetical protein
MNPLPDLRSNLGTWAVPLHQLPALTRLLCEALPAEEYDPDFRGQRLETTYFDTQTFRLRKARRRHDQYLTLRLRCYRDDQGNENYVLSAKTEAQKWRREISAEVAERILCGPPVDWTATFLPADLLSRLQELSRGEPLLPCVTVKCVRYAVENDQDRYTLDVHVRTDTGKRLPFAVLEFKSTRSDGPDALAGLILRPLKLSKFLWATEV